MRPTQLWRDERAIEGLPVRLVIALVVGVASLSVMMGMLGGIDGLGVSEVNAEPETDVIPPGSVEITVVVQDANGEPIEDATVVLTSGTAQLGSPITAETGKNGKATLSGSEASLGPNQDQGTLEIEIKPPAGGGYTDKRGNADILVIEGASKKSSST